MAGKEEYYSILGLSTTATPEEIRKAFLVRSKDSHPDKNSGSIESNLEFQKINEAYSTLSDSEKRIQYDW